MLDVGRKVGARVGARVGALVGERVGEVGALVGCGVGTPVGLDVGRPVGAFETGAAVGAFETGAGVTAQMKLIESRKKSESNTKHKRHLQNEQRTSRNRCAPLAKATHKQRYRPNDAPVPSRLRRWPEKATKSAREPSFL